MVMGRIIVCLLGCTACNQATLTTTPDASEADACIMHASVFCEAGPQGCVGGGSDPYVGMLPSDASFGLGCKANVIGTERDPVSGVCKLAATCSCDGDDAGDAAPPAWVCTP